MRPTRSFHWAVSIGAGGLAALCACASAPRQPAEGPAQALALPAAWSAPQAPVTPAAESLAQWWQGCSDATLTGLVTESLQANSDVRTANARLAQSRALRDLASSALWPSVTALASVQAGTVGGHSTGRVLQASAAGSWDPDVFGGNRSGLRASLATLQASADRVGDARVAVASEVGIGYILLRSTQSRLAIAAENLASQQETLQIVRWRTQAGLASELDVDQAATAAEQTAALLPLLQVSEAQARHALAVLAGRAPTALDGTLAAVQPVPSCDAGLALGIPADTLRQRADVRAAEQDVAAAWAQVAQARAARWPDFTLSGSLGTSAATVSALGTGAAAVSTLLASVALPLIDGGARRATVRLRQAALEQASVAYQATVLAALKDVEDALAALRGDEPRLQSLQRAATAALAADDLAQLQYRSGLVDFQVVLDTQRARLAAQDALASAQAQLGSDDVRLYSALGGGWREEDLRTSRR
jgi:NodT family efflux transporter outer membrane factor (OMF) lipoprotein